jgi:peptidoglycan/xylan/chitin deacetylase (PgdA/CDA1 family)
MIIRRMVLTVVLILFASVTAGVIVGLDDVARSTLAQRSPTSGGTSHTVPTTAAPTHSRQETATPRPKHTTAHPRSAGPSATATTPQPRSSTKPSPTRAKPTLTRKPTTQPKPRRDRGTVYLTFDDGPSPYTPQILKILRNTGSTATFFQLGVNTPGQAHIVTAIRAQGSNIGNHSYNHPDLTTLNATQLRWQIAHGPQARCFRPPYGATNKTVRQAIRRAGAHQVLWDVDTLDWTHPGVKKLENLGARNHVSAGNIILMHDGGGTREQTVAALPGLIHHLRDRGLIVRALPQCN